jgi:hypothetical protein
LREQLTRHGPQQEQEAEPHSSRYTTSSGPGVGPTTEKHQTTKP